MKETKYLIIGAGISGLTFANYIKENYIIVEKEKEVGGYCRTIKRGGFIWDYAGHFFHFKTDEFKKFFMNNISELDIVKKVKCTKILYRNKLINYPFQMNIHELEKNEFIDCLYDLYNKVEKDEYENFLDMLYGKFGKAIVEKFLKPYNEKLYACDLQNLDTNAMGRFFPYANINQIINNMKQNNATSYNDCFMYPKAGANAFVDILNKNINQQNVLLNTKITEINWEDRIAKTNSGENIKFEYLINTMALNEFLGFFANEEYNVLKNEMSYNKVLVLNLGFNKKSKLTQEHWIYIPDKTSNYYRIGFYDNILNMDKLSMYIEIGYSKNDSINVKEQLNLTIQNLKKDKIIDESFVLEDYEAIIMNPAYIHISTNVNNKIKSVLKQLNNNKIYSIGRYGAWTYCSIEDCMAEAKSLANRIS